MAVLYTKPDYAERMAGRTERRKTTAADRGRATITRTLDALGLVAYAYDRRAHLGYLTDRATRARNERLQAAGAPDGLPLPSPALVYAVAGHFDVQEYFNSGRIHAQLLRDVLTRNGFDIGGLGAILDFGCGCGRVVRNWRDLRATRVHGCDYNPTLIEWCREALPFAEFRVNELRPSLPYAAGEFDFVYAISVFTHLTEPLQHAWMADLERVLAPGGLLLITTKGASRLGPLDEEERERFDEGQLVVQAARYVGRNLCAAYHPESYVRERLAEQFLTVDYLPADDGLQTQDVYLLQKPLRRSPGDRRRLSHP
jgi:SAM-dependent methyltransferase